MLENNYKGLYKLKGPSRTPLLDSTRIQNVAPLVAPIPDDVEQQDSGMGNLQNLTSLAGSLSGGLPTSAGKGTIPGQLPGTEFNMGAVNMPGTEQRTPTTSREFDADKFARMAGAFGAAIAPRGSWQARLGATASGLAAENLRGREEQEQARLEAPQKALDMELTQARIDKLRREDKEKRYVSIGSGGLYDTQTGQTISSIEKLKDKKPTVKDFQIGGRVVPHQLDEETGEWKPIKGMGGPKWNPKSTAAAGEMTESKARKELLNLAKYKQKLSETGGMDDILFAMISRDNPELAESLRGSDKTEILGFIEEQEGYYRKFAPGTKSKSNKPSWKDYK